jgi:plastocyanin domain-containing protein
MQTKLLYSSIVVVILLIGGAVYFSNGDTGVGGTRPEEEREPVRSNSVASSTIENGVQYIDITARGGYTPKLTHATAGLQTVIRMRTENTFDCSTALVIPALGFNDYLERTGVKEIPVPADKAQGTLQGLCSMGMYRFQVEFE